MDQTIWQKMQKIDSRIFYVVLIVMIVLPLMFPGFKLPIIPSQQTISAYNTIEQAANAGPGKIALVDSWWAASTQGEQKWQAKAVLTQLMRDHIPFALISGDPQNRTLTDQLVKEIAPKYNYVYGVNYVDFGYKSPGAYAAILKGMVQDIPGTLKEDYKNQSLSSFPVMKGIHDIHNVSIIIEITPSSTLDQMLQLVQGVNHTPLVFVPTAVMAPESYPYLDSHQISGIVTGIKGAGDYEQLLGLSDFGTQASTALSMVYALIILLIILGNVGYHMARSAQNQGEERIER
jgi:hypothetical protein